MKKIKEFVKRVIGDNPKEYLVLFLVLSASMLVGGILISISERSLQYLINPFSLSWVAYLVFRVVYYFKYGKKLCEEI